MADIFLRYKDKWGLSLFVFKPFFWLINIGNERCLNNLPRLKQS